MNVETVVSEGGIEALVPYLELAPETLDRPDEEWMGWRWVLVIVVRAFLLIYVQAENVQEEPQQ